MTWPKPASTNARLRSNGLCAELEERLPRSNGCATKRVACEKALLLGVIELMLKRHGEKALDESAARADELALAGDDEGATTWRRIMAAVEQLANKTPPGRVN